MHFIVTKMDWRIIKIENQANRISKKIKLS